MDAALRDQVRQRARSCCEYCRLPQAQAPLAAFHVEHITAKQHLGPTVLPNLAYACHQCNLHKGPNLTGLDSRTRKLVKLFNPRRHKWAYHFCWDGPHRVGRTAIGRVTIQVLAMNDGEMVRIREALIAAGLFPPL